MKSAPAVDRLNDRARQIYRQLCTTAVSEMEKDHRHPESSVDTEADVIPSRRLTWRRAMVVIGLGALALTLAAIFFTWRQMQVQQLADIRAIQARACRDNVNNGLITAAIEPCTAVVGEKDLISMDDWNLLLASEPYDVYVSVTLALRG